MIESERTKRLAGKGDFPRSFRNCANAHDRQPGYLTGNSRPWSNGEQELIIFAAVQGLLKRGASRNRQPPVEPSSAVRFLAYAIEIQGYPIAQIHSGRRNRTQLQPGINARLRTPLPQPVGSTL